MSLGVVTGLIQTWLYPQQKNQWLENSDLETKDIYRNDPKFSDKQVWANSADPDQTAPRGAV